MDVISYALSKKYTDEKIIEQKLKVATVEKELNDYKNTLAQVNVNQEPRQSASGYGIVGLPKNAANGQVSVGVKGSSYANILGTRGKGHTLSGWNSTTRITLGSNDFKDYFYMDLETGPPVGRIPCNFNANDKIYIQLITKSNIVNGTGRISLYAEKNGASTSEVFIPQVATTVDSRQSGIIVVNENADTFRISRNSSALSGERLGIKQILAVNITSMGLSNLTKEQCDQMFGYIDDAKSTISAMRLKSVNEGETEETIQYIIGKDQGTGEILELRSLPNGTKDEISVSEGKLIKRVSDDFIISDNHTWGMDDELTNTVRFYSTSLINYLPSQAVQKTGTTMLFMNGEEVTNSEITTGIDKEIQSLASNGIYRIRINKNRLTSVSVAGFKEYLRQNIVALTYQLASEEIIPIEVSGNLTSYPNGTIYIEPAVADASVYNNKITIFEQELNIDYIDKLYKIDYQTGVKTEIDTSKAVIAEDRKSFTHPDLMNGDMVFFEYFYSNESTQGEATVEYYDSRYVIKDKSTDKFYQWDIEVDNGVPSIKLVEV